MRTITDLRKRRFDRDLTLEQVFILSGGRLWPSRLSVIERNIVCPTRRERVALLEIFGIPEEELFPKKVRAVACPGAEGETP